MGMCIPGRLVWGVRPSGPGSATYGQRAAQHKTKPLDATVYPSILMEQVGTILNEFSWNLIFVYCLKICRENSSFTKMWQEWRVLYMKTNVHLSCLAELFLKWEMFQTKVVEEIETLRVYTSAAPERVRTNWVALLWDEVGQPCCTVISNFI